MLKSKWMAMVGLVAMMSTTAFGAGFTFEEFDSGLNGWSAFGVAPGASHLAGTLGPDGDPGVAQASRNDGGFSVTFEAADFINPGNPFLGNWVTNYRNPGTGLITVNFWHNEIDGNIGPDAPVSMWVGDRFVGLNRYRFPTDTGTPRVITSDPGWKNYEVSFDPTWSVATATANGWESWTAGVMTNVNRFGIFGTASTSGADTIWVDRVFVGDGPAIEIPEPATLALLGLGGLVLIRRRRS